MTPFSVKVLLRSHAYQIIASLWFLLLLNCNGSHCAAESIKITTSKLVEQVDLDWDHSGKRTRFALSTELPNTAGHPNIFTIQRAGIKPLILTNKDGGWGKVATLSPLLKHRNMITAQRMFFIAAGPVSDARIYLILIGEGSSCCVGSLTVLTPDKDGTPRTVFYENQHLLYDARQLEDASGIQLIAKSGDSEAWTIKMQRATIHSVSIFLEMFSLQSTICSFQSPTQYFTTASGLVPITTKNLVQFRSQMARAIAEL